MPNILLKLFRIKCLIGSLVFCLGNSLQAEEMFARGDSLFNAGNYEEAMRIYKKNHEKNKRHSSAMLLKMAYIEENSGNYTYALYYLSLYDLINPSNETLKKTAELAEKHTVSGYEYTDVSFFSVLMRKYREKAVIVLCILFGLTVLMILRERSKGRLISTPVKSLFFILSAILLILNNSDLSGQRGIVARPHTLLMSGPSAGSETAGTAEQGTCVDVTGKEDIWHKIKTSEKTVYVREGNLLLIE